MLNVKAENYREMVSLFQIYGKRLPTLYVRGFACCCERFIGGLDSSRYGSSGTGTYSPLQLKKPQPLSFWTGFNLPRGPYCPDSDECSTISYQSDATGVAAFVASDT